MISKILIISFIVILVFNLINALIIVYHFKKFSIKNDIFSKKIVKTFIRGMLSIAILTFLFLLILVIA